MLAIRTSVFVIGPHRRQAVLYRHFSTSSDVWSFGILMWEIWSYGAVSLFIVPDIVERLLDFRQSPTFFPPLQRFSIV
jgi:hypothetical protein